MTSIVWLVVGLLVVLGIMVRVPMVQSVIGQRVASLVADKLGTSVSVGRVDVAAFNRVIIDDLCILDQQGKTMVQASRLSAKVSLHALATGRISISSAQIFSPRFNLYKITAEAKPNFQFVLDSLASKDKTKKSKMEIAINSLVIRHGSVSWNQLDAPLRTSNNSSSEATTSTNGRTLDPNHLKITNISSHIIVGAISSDSLDVFVKRLALKEASGLDIKSLSLKAVRSDNNLRVSDFMLTLPHSTISIPKASLLTKKAPSGASTAVSPALTYAAEIAKSTVNFSDICCLLPFLRNIDAEAEIIAKVSGSDKRIDINSLLLRVLHNGSQALRLSATASANLPLGRSPWTADVRQLSVNSDGLNILGEKVPEAVKRLQSVDFKGKATGWEAGMKLDGNIATGAGNAVVALTKEGDNVDGHVSADNIDLGRILDNNSLSTLSADITGKGNIKTKTFNAQGKVRHFGYNNYTYKDIVVDTHFANNIVEGDIKIDDANASAVVQAIVNLSEGGRAANVKAYVARLSPARLNLFHGRAANATYQAELTADVKGSSIDNAIGSVEVRNFNMTADSIRYSLDSLLLQAGDDEQGHYVSLKSDFGHAIMHGASNGQFNFASLVQIVENVVVTHLPSISHLAPFKYRPVGKGAFSVEAHIHDSRLANVMFGIPLEINSPLSLSATISPTAKSGIGSTLDADISCQDIVYADNHIRNLSTTIRTVGDYLDIDASLRKVAAEDVADNATGTDLSLEALTGNDKINASLKFDNNAKKQRFKGCVNTNVELGKNPDGVTQALLDIKESTFSIGDSLFTIHPATILYSKKRVEVDGLKVNSNSQGITVDGCATTDASDSLVARLHNVNVSYIQDVIGFHSVDFGGYVSGKAFVSQIFSKPAAHGTLSIDDFRFMDGRLGTLNTDVAWNPSRGQIDIDAMATDTMLLKGNIVRPRNTVVKGYISPTRNDIDLALQLNDTRGEFVGNLCSAFMNDVELTGSGSLRLAGSLKAINLMGDVDAYGQMTVTPLGTHYTMPHGHIHFIENEIIFEQDSIYDDAGSLGVVTGALHHKNLGRMTYDIDIAANDLLAFNLDGSDGSLFYGRVRGSGTANIKGKSGEVEIDVEMTPSSGSEVVYDISSPEALTAQDFITWTSHTSDSVLPSPSLNGTRANVGKSNFLTNIHLNLAIKATPEASMKIITDKLTGDYITLHGTGDLRATYYNKGAINVYGTYTIDHGVYSLTIQNVIKKVFDFAQGGTIVFGGDPYNAILNLKAQYPIASVSLADLQVGRSFSSSNIRVTCLMDITGTPEAPKVDFGLDFPTMSTDAKQMVYSLINGEEEMNQQVLYLLAVGRFYSKGVNNADAQTSQTSLAMQSIVSGQLSQQINNVLSSLMKTSNWNFGANISTGTEGLNNADYEGLLSGRMLHNRLLFNGQFGYRDNANATTSFIGDFDLRYLIFPNGNLSIHVYNQANDRYFTRNTLNTQGIGFILKKDFGSLKDIFTRNKLTKKRKKSKK